MKKDYLYHGSPVKVDKLLPSQAYDTEYNEGCQYAVYATSNKMIFRNCHPNYDKKGYVYVLDKSKFKHAMGSQWVCYEEVIPDSIEEINVNDYLEYCIIQNC